MPDLFIASNPDSIGANGNQSDPSDPPVQSDTPTDAHRRLPQDQTQNTAENTTESNATLQPATESNIQEAKQEQKNNMPLFASFWQHPTGIYFDTQEIDEQILLFLRRHPITNTNWILGTLLLALIPPAVIYIFSFLLRKTFIIDTVIFTSAIIIFYYLIVATIAFTYFLNWYYNITLITQKRVMTIILSNVIVKKIAETKISLVQDVNYQQTGAVRTLFNYGDVLIQTAGTLDNFYIYAIPQPENVVHIVEDLIGEEGPFPING